MSHSRAVCWQLRPTWQLRLCIYFTLKALFVLFELCSFKPSSTQDWTMLKLVRSRVWQHLCKHSPLLSYNAPHNYIIILWLMFYRQPFCPGCTLFFQESILKKILPRILFVKWTSWKQWLQSADYNYSFHSSSKTACLMWCHLFACYKLFNKMFYFFIFAFSQLKYVGMQLVSRITLIIFSQITLH